MQSRTSKCPRATPSGIHHLQSESVLRAIVRSAHPVEGDHVFDLGAGPGTLTAALSRTGATVTAVERDAAFVRDLRRRFDRSGHVKVVAADLRTVSIPRRAKVVANVPFATSAGLLAKLLDPPGTPRGGIDLLVEHGFAIRVSARLPRSAQGAWWAARYDLRLVRVVAPNAFAPAPAVSGALLRIRAREPLGGDAERRLRRLLAAVYAAPHRRAATIARRFAGRRAGPRILRDAGADPYAAAAQIPPQAWAAVARGPFEVRVHYGPL